MGVVKRYRKREPVEVDAVRVSIENVAEVAAWCGGRVVEATYFDPEDSSYKELGKPVGIKLLTRERLQVALIGDYIFKDGEDYFNKRGLHEFDFEYEPIKENKV